MALTDPRRWRLSCCGRDVTLELFKRDGQIVAEVECCGIFRSFKMMASGDWWLTRRPTTDRGEG